MSRWCRSPKVALSQQSICLQREAMENALRQLFILGCTELAGAITELGRRLARLPLDPGLGRLLVAAAQLGCLEQACTICAMLSADSIFLGSRCLLA